MGGAAVAPRALVHRGAPEGSGAVKRGGTGSPFAPSRTLAAQGGPAADSASFNTGWYDYQARPREADLPRAGRAPRDLALPRHVGQPQQQASVGRLPEPEARPARGDRARADPARGRGCGRGDGPHPQLDRGRLRPVEPRRGDLRRGGRRLLRGDAVSRPGPEPHGGERASRSGAAGAGAGELPPLRRHPAGPRARPHPERVPGLAAGRDRAPRRPAPDPQPRQGGRLLAIAPPAPQGRGDAALLQGLRRRGGGVRRPLPPAGPGAAGDRGEHGQVPRVPPRLHPGARGAHRQHVGGRARRRGDGEAGAPPARGPGAPQPRGGGAAQGPRGARLPGHRRLPGDADRAPGGEGGHPGPRQRPPAGGGALRPVRLRLRARDEDVPVRRLLHAGGGGRGGGDGADGGRAGGADRLRRPRRGAGAQGRGRAAPLLPG